ncbi:MAG: hypothetical protein SFT68_05110 [Rickettsiaceae bacterium]|nr:hypothetical protein [Rickettsiaceae bacterium]
MQRYSNCAPEVIENFMLYLTGERLSQEDAIINNSRLVEEELLFNKTTEDFWSYEYDKILELTGNNTEI